MIRKKYKVIGLMSGTSLDGLDIAYCEFQFDGKWKFNIRKATTIAYSNWWKETLTGWPLRSCQEHAFLDMEYGTFMGKQVRSFVKRNKLRPDFIASHGHTVFHQPARGFTLQVGNGSALSASSGLPVVCDFRSKDIALGGQGAPLVPVGDNLLFKEYMYCLNLGGIANISMNKKGKRIAFDICPCNMILNELAGREGMEYDKNGSLAARGKIIPSLLEELNQKEYYKKKHPKSLGREDIETGYDLVLNAPELKTADLLATFCEHIAIQIAKQTAGGNLLITGGGAGNKFLIQRIRKHTRTKIVLPSKQIIDFKEALIFAFLGVLRMRNEVNCLASVTGAKSDSSGGAVYV